MFRWIAFLVGALSFLSGAELQPLPHFPLTASLRAKTKIEQRDLESQNVIASLPGSDPMLKSEYVVVH